MNVVVLPTDRFYQPKRIDDGLSSVVYPSDVVSCISREAFYAQTRTRRRASGSTLSPILISTTFSPSLAHQSRILTDPIPQLTSTTAKMTSQEAKLLSDFLLAPAPLRDFMTLRQFTDIFPRSHRENPAVQDLYRELQRLRETEIEVVRSDITKEVKRSKQLRRAYAQERRQVDDAHITGIDPIILQTEEEVLLSKAKRHGSAS